MTGNAFKCFSCPQVDLKNNLQTLVTRTTTLHGLKSHFKYCIEVFTHPLSKIYPGEVYHFLLSTHSDCFHVDPDFSGQYKSDYRNRLNTWIIDAGNQSQLFRIQNDPYIILQPKRVHTLTHTHVLFVFKHLWSNAVTHVPGRSDHINVEIIRYEMEKKKPQLMAYNELHCCVNVLALLLIWSLRFQISVPSFFCHGNQIQSNIFPSFRQVKWLET